VTGYLASMALGFLSARGRGYRHLLKDVPLMPLYWLLISAAAYRALWQFMTARFEWKRRSMALPRPAWDFFGDRPRQSQPSGCPPHFIETAAPKGDGTIDGGTWT
jgi:hypothetical protein